MQLFYLYYFKIVAETQNMSRASKLLHVSQPALSKNIANLEKDLGVTLFEREKRRIRLSPVGEEYYNYISKAFDLIEAGDCYIERYKDATGGMVTVGTTNTELLPQLLQGFIDTHPDNPLQINQYIYTPEILVEQLLKGNLSFALTSIPILTTDISQKKLMDEEILLIVSADHPFASQSTIRLADCKDQVFLVNDANFDKKAVTDCCKLVGFEPNIGLCSNEPDFIRNAMEHQKGITLVPANVFYQLHKSGTAVALRFSDIEIRRMITVTTCSRHMPVGMAKEFYNFTCDFFSQLGNTVETFLRAYFPPADFGERKSLHLDQIKPRNRESLEHSVV